MRHRPGASSGFGSAMLAHALGGGGARPAATVYFALTVLIVALLGLDSGMRFPAGRCRSVATSAACACRHTRRDDGKVALKVLDLIKDEAGGRDKRRCDPRGRGCTPPNYPINLIYLWNGGSDEASCSAYSSRTA